LRPDARGQAACRAHSRQMGRYRVCIVIEGGKAQSHPAWAGLDASGGCRHLRRAQPWTSPFLIQIGGGGRTAQNSCKCVAVVVGAQSEFLFWVINNALASISPNIERVGFSCLAPPLGAMMFNALLDLGAAYAGSSQNL
jgi:hypothetical protein